MLYPLKFKPIYKTKVWGGDKIRRIKNDDTIPENCGESWEISGVQDDVSVVANGFLKGNTLQEVIEVYLDEVVGEKVLEEYGYEFPILLKIIDAKDNLSVQVHPDDETAAELHNARGKTEAWYILEADNDAKIIDGFNRDTTERELLQSIQDGNLENLLKYQNVKSGDFRHNLPHLRLQPWQPRTAYAIRRGCHRLQEERQEFDPVFAYARPLKQDCRVQVFYSQLFASDEFTAEGL